MRTPQRSFALLALVVVGLGCGDTRVNGPTVVFGGGSTEVALSAITLSAGSLNPPFDATITLYTVDVGNNTPSIRISPTVRAGLTVFVSGAQVPSGSLSADIPLAVGVNNIPIEVRGDGSQVRSYTVAVRRSAT